MLSRSLNSLLHFSSRIQPSVSRIAALRHLPQSAQMYTFGAMLPTETAETETKSQNESEQSQDPSSSVEMWDCHAHLTYPDFDKDLPSVLKRAQNANVTKIICVAENPDDCEKLLVLKEKHSDIISICAGMHPCQVPLSLLCSVAACAPYFCTF